MDSGHAGMNKNGLETTAYLTPGRLESLRNVKAVTRNTEAKLVLFDFAGILICERKEGEGKGRNRNLAPAV